MISDPSLFTATWTMVFAKQQLHPKDRQAVLTCLAREESPTPPLSPHHPGPITRNDRITNKSIRRRTEAAETQGLGGSEKMECQCISVRGKWVVGCPQDRSLASNTSHRAVICPWCWIVLLSVNLCWREVTGDGYQSFTPVLEWVYWGLMKLELGDRYSEIINT